MPVWGEFLIVLGALGALVFLPGVLLTYGLFPGKRLDIFERIPIGFGLVCGFLVGLFFFARVFAWGWFQLFTVWIGLILLLMSVTWLLPRFHSLRVSLKFQLAQSLGDVLPRAATDDEQMANQPVSRVLIGFFALALMLGAFLTHIGPVDEDDWSYFQIVREFADAIGFAPVSLSDRNVVHVWWLIHAAIVHTFDVDLVRLGQDWMPLIFVPVSLLAFYALARALFLDRNLAIAAILLQFVSLLVDLFNPYKWVPLPGQWLFTRMDQDHTIVIFLFLPVFAAMLIWYLREGSWALLGATLVAQVGLIAIHAMLGIVLSALTLIGVLLIEGIVARPSQERKRVVWLGILTAILFCALAPMLPAVFGARAPAESALQYAQLADGVFPFSHYRYTFFSPTAFTLRADFLGQPPALAAILLTPLLIPFLRKDLAARYLFVSSVGLLLVLYVPPILQFLESQMSVTVLRLWNWNPKVLIIAYFLPHFYPIVRDGWAALRRRAWNTRASQAALLCVVLIALLALWPAFLRPDWPPELGVGHALPNGAHEMLKALREHTVPGEQAAVLAGHDISSAIPAYRVTLIPILFREDLRGPKGRDVVGFLDAVLMTNTQLEILNKYQVKYLLISGERESVSQCDLLPEYFQPLFRNSYGALYRVASPLESNALIEANTVANYGEWEGAIQAYDAVLAAEPDNSLAHTGLGMILQFLGKPKAAVREFEAAVRVAPTNAQAHAHLVHLYRQLGMNDQAAAHIPAAGRLMESEPK